MMTHTLGHPNSFEGGAGEKPEVKISSLDA